MVMPQGVRRKRQEYSALSGGKEYSAATADVGETATRDWRDVPSFPISGAAKSGQEAAAEVSVRWPAAAQIRLHGLCRFAGGSGRALE